MTLWCIGWCLYTQVSMVFVGSEGSTKPIVLSYRGFQLGSSLTITVNTGAVRTQHRPLCLHRAPTVPARTRA